MPRSLQIRRSRKYSRREGSGQLVAALALALALVAGLGLLAASAYLAVVSGLPDVGLVEAQFGMRGAETFRPLLAYDSLGEHVLYQHLHPDAQQRQWIEPESAPANLMQATVAAIQPDYWTSPGYDLTSQTATTISERLVEIALLPPGEPSLARVAQRTLLAAELTRRYPKERILTWYLNSADYGEAAYGIDSAALVRYGKHADELSLGESASLAAMLDPQSSQLEPEVSRENVLNIMVDAGFVTQAQARIALDDPLPSQDGVELARFATFLMEQVTRELGELVVGRSGLKVISTIDYDLQQQAACAAESHLSRLSGEPIGTVIATSEGSPCVSAALLPTLRPRDAGIDHQIEDWALVVIDPVSGEILAAQGSFDEARSPEALLDPFTYLTAFSRGSTPSSMVVDLGPDPHGPVRMRTALANLYADAAETTLAALGQESINRTLGQLGLNEPSDSTSLIELISAYGVLAADGKRTGVESGPTIVRRIEDSEGTILYEYSPLAQAVVSPQLAFLMVDALSDESARWEELGKGNSLEIGRAAGAISGTSSEDTDNWAIGFTPQRAVGVWLGGSPLAELNRENGAAAIWNAAIRFASAELAPESWQMPLGVAEIEVCDPSGLLPTQYCPEIVREVFILGTEPTQYDNLYQPFRVNRETGKLATLLTPLQSVEEHVYFIPPPAAEAWAAEMGIEQPPQEYDTLSSDLAEIPGIQIMSPAPFEILGDSISVRGDANTDGFDYYRLQYGQGLNPTRWIQIGDDQQRPVDSSRLGTWLTDGLNGLYTLQLLVVLNDGQVRTAALPVTLDNESPIIELLIPLAGEVYSLDEVDELTISVSALDEVGLERVDIFADGRRIGSIRSAPFTVDWTLPNEIGEYEIFAHAYDAAGNRAESQRIQIEIVP
jgi:membrane peptidoglycan carboxypeptidase